MTAPKVRPRTKWTALLIYLLAASLGYGGLSICVAAHGDFGAGYSYCCRYWCAVDSRSPGSAHFDHCGSASSGLEQGSDDGSSCRDYSFFVIPRERASQVQQGSATKAPEGLLLAERLAPSLAHVPARAPSPRRLYQLFDPVMDAPSSVVLLL
ncbi:MAG: hypothetical protein P8182_12055 [Deltaproteobacteria bacterium]